MSEKIPRKVIYIGSIPFDQTEEQVLDIAQSIGPVVNMKMMFDKETGKSKGYAFIEYADIETASSAVRNLNNYSIGNRHIKCDFSSDDNLTNTSSIIMQKKLEETLPPLPPGLILKNDESFSDSISNTLQSFDQIRLNNIIKDCHAMAVRNPVLFGELLAQCPQLSYAIVETLLLTNKVQPDQVSEILINNGGGVPSNDNGSSNNNNSGSNEFEQLDQEKIALIKQVLQIPDSDLAALPQDQLASILEIKENARRGLYGSQIF